MLHVSFLGEQAITDDRAGSIRGRSSRVVALVAFLVLHAGSAQARQRIAGLLWPESTDAQALTNLRRELHHLRQILGDEPSLVVTPRELCWNDTKTCRVDVRVFDTERKAALVAAAADDDDGILRHAPAAIAAYQGELLPGVYDDWLLDARAQLERQCLDLCDLACAARARVGDLAGAMDTARHRIPAAAAGGNRDGYDFSHDLLRETAYAGISPPRRWLLHRRIAQGLELLHAEDTDSVAAQLAEQYARAGRPERAVAYYQRAADVAGGMFAHAEKIRLHERALAIIAATPPGRDRDSSELAVLEAMAAPLNARYGYSSPDVQQALERSIVLAESLGRRDSRVVGLAALGAAMFVQGRTADSHRTATRAGPRRPRVRAGRPGAFRRRLLGLQPGDASRWAASPGIGCEAGERCRPAERRHPPRCARQGLFRACPLAARPRGRSAGRLPRGHHPGPGDRPSV